MTKIIVQKFGGTSVGNAERLNQVASIVQHFNRTNPVVAVVSAISPEIKAKGTTSLLLKAANQAQHGHNFRDAISTIATTHKDIVNEAITSSTLRRAALNFVEEELDRIDNFLKAISVIQELTYLSIDNVISVGERLSAFVLTQTLLDRNINAKFVDLAHLVHWESKEVDTRFFHKVQEALAEHCDFGSDIVPVLTGFFGPIPGGMLEKVGRGYTDFTAALATAGLGSNRVLELQVWKEVDGICTADPRRVSNSKLLSEISAIEASELTHFGSEVLHPFTMERVTSACIPIRVKNTFNPQGHGTCVVNTPPLHNMPITAITAKKGVTVVTLTSNRMFNTYGFLARVFGVLKEHGIVVDLVSTSEISISFSVDQSCEIERARGALEELGQVTIETNLAILAIVGQNIKASSNTASTLFTVLSKENIETAMISKGASRVNISCIIPEGAIDRALGAVHDAFFN